MTWKGFEWRVLLFVTRRNPFLWLLIAGARLTKR
jgi:hypothetical protein